MNLSSDPINTLENLIAKNKTKSISIYLLVVLAAGITVVGGARAIGYYNGYYDTKK